MLRVNLGCATGIVAALSLATLASCEGSGVEERAWKAAQGMLESLEDVDAEALAQEIDPDMIRRVQKQLSLLNEYQGQITGELDRVTLNAIQAFQRSQGLEDDGFLDERTLKALQKAAARPPSDGCNACPPFHSAGR